MSGYPLKPGAKEYMPSDYKCELVRVHDPKCLEELPILCPTPIKRKRGRPSIPTTLERVKELYIRGFSLRNLLMSANLTIGARIWLNTKPLHIPQDIANIYRSRKISDRTIRQQYLQKYDVHVIIPPRPQQPNAVIPHI